MSKKQVTKQPRCRGERKRPPFTDEHKRALSEAQKRRYARIREALALLDEREAA
jgi:hypothetical protein